MKRPYEAEQSWPRDLLEFVGKAVCAELYSYFDFLSWHSTCHILWAPFEQHFYGDYLLQFLKQCEERNKAKALLTVQASFHLQYQDSTLCSYRIFPSDGSPRLNQALPRLCRLLLDG